ncbi:cytochrome c oxidase subunit VIb [Fennellomyces sp. T-0311]|nr:cytochrome c oxidase subunit VIb [Fennellomyces sp. T-0311]
MSDAESANVKLTTAGFDARFPNTNQTKHCWQNYVDYYKCINARGEEFEPCKQFRRAYYSLCPNEWISKWDSQREEGTNPSNFEV